MLACCEDMDVQRGYVTCLNSHRSSKSQHGLSLRHVLLYSHGPQGLVEVKKTKNKKPPKYPTFQSFSNPLFLTYPHFGCPSHQTLSTAVGALELCRIPLGGLVSVVWQLGGISPTVLQSLHPTPSRLLSEAK